MLYRYRVVEPGGAEKEGTIEAVTVDVAISALQRRGLVIVDIGEADKATSIWQKNLGIFERVSNRDVVILSRQIATLFEAQVSALRVFKLLAGETENPKLGRILGEVVEDLQGGSSIAAAMGKHPEVFSSFYANMVRAGEESGKLQETFLFLADYLDRTYEVTQKARNALVYPAFVIFTFFAVMILMMTLVVPKISAVLLESGQELPIYTRIIIGISEFLLDFRYLIMAVVVFGGLALWGFRKSIFGAESFDRFKITVPYVGDLFRKLYLSRISDNMNTLLSSGIPMVKTLELTSSVLENRVYESAVLDALEAVKGGVALSDAFGRSPEFPGILVQMVKVGEETGNLGKVLSTLAAFYRREVSNAVDTLVGLIEPVMIILLGIGVGTVLAAVLIPIYNLSSAL
jgi:type II secretory pathway component PulF